ncbi:HAD-IIA family hydrolase [Nocardia cyriacigeorgica]|uniref:HAD-IIA family hydrolase n=1 Tax=Nocardia cyriacigeorgica TaxID=135487 RepID=A0A6P1D539_9NOCA|nr:HAD-IIA family hydrolase [Nocardia cyriacigeorgica]NEW39601.1 HAD-IIA family hydrolase [Nocardia cyriacigeorgica]NEW44659.1 HAD-IIA family hydrolase [Nocardia cyriacigeorgica]NEW50089.1 HAD-IIA family hydrolase [Nocardia cyriacigeorgica]NEW57264.1 HAD-IIA family hydrolase [Nocardia cyriacigeorgica]
MADPNRIAGVLYDIDGVLVTSWRALPGAPDAVRRLAEQGLHRAFLTNTTSRTQAEIADRLCAAGIEVSPAEIVTAARLTVEYLRRDHPDARALVLNHGDIDVDLADLRLVDEDPEVVVIGGAGPEFTHRALSRVVEWMLDGVPVVAMQGGMTWATEDGLRIDTGAYLPGLEAAGNASITVVGKPSATGFQTCAATMDLAPEKVLMAGDDLHSDVLAAQAVGMTGVLVRTGKFRAGVLESSARQPDHVIDSVADLPGLLEVSESGG